MEWDELRIFLAAWNTRSFTRAASELRVGQATVSRRIAMLEERLGHVLFDRRRGGLVPTAAGEVLHPYAESIASTFLNATAAIEGFEVEAEGAVYLGVTPAISVELLPALLVRLRKRHPRIAVHVSTRPSTDAVARRELDLAIVGELSAERDLLVRKLVDVEFALFGSAAFARRLSSRPKLADLDIIGWGGELGALPAGRWLDERMSGRFVATADTTLTMAAMARHGLGAILLPRLIGRMSGLTEILAKLDGVPGYPLYLAVHRATRQVPRVAAVVDLVLEALRETRA
jgi:DNA-binding transcriptional LysR family regulator